MLIESKVRIAFLNSKILHFYTAMIITRFFSGDKLIWLTLHEILDGIYSTGVFDAVIFNDNDYWAGELSHWACFATGTKPCVENAIKLCSIFHESSSL